MRIESSIEMLEHDVWPNSYGPLHMFLLVPNTRLNVTEAKIVLTKL